MTFEEIVKLLAEIEPIRDNDYGDEYCFFCGELVLAGEINHRKDCVWCIAREAINKG